MSFTKDTEDLKLFDTREGSLTQATEHFQNQKEEMLLMTERSKNQRLSQDIDSPAAISRQLFYGSKRSLTSEHSYYGNN